VDVTPFGILDNPKPFSVQLLHDVIRAGRERANACTERVFGTTRMRSEIANRSTDCS
jgi:hypothetical protein